MVNSSKVAIQIGPDEIVYKGNIVAVVHQQMKIGDKTRVFEVAQRSPGTRSIIISPEDKILITKEYRHDINEFDFRLPGGKICDTLTEYLELKKDPKKVDVAAEEGAKKEVLEETGLEANSLDLFTVIGTGATTIVHDLYYFVIKDFSGLSKQSLGEGEDIQVGWYTFPEAIGICLSGKMKEARSAAVLLQYFHSIGKI